MILPGVNIGDNVIIGAGSVVTKSIKNNCEVAGNPAKILCFVNDLESKMVRYNINAKNLTPKKMRDLLLSLSEESFLKKKYL